MDNQDDIKDKLWNMLNENSLLSNLTPQLKEPVVPSTSPPLSSTNVEDLLVHIRVEVETAWQTIADLLTSLGNSRLYRYFVEPVEDLMLHFSLLDLILNVDLDDVDCKEAIRLVILEWRATLLSVYSKTT